MFSHDKQSPREVIQISSYTQAYQKAYKLAQRRPYYHNLLAFVHHKSKPVGDYMLQREEIVRSYRGFVDGYFMGVLSKRG